MLVNVTLFKKLKHFADKNNGRLISREITVLKSPKSIKFECSKGHRWEVATHKALESNWCPKCSGNKQRRNTIEDMKLIAEERGGKCLSSQYINTESKLLWECSEGHQWKSNAHSVKNKGSWCPTCKSEKQKNTIEDMHVLASKRGGKCISTEYILNNVPIEWECEFGHTWFAQPSNITTGEWCPTCTGNKKKTIEEVQLVAKERGGRLLSKEYINQKQKLKWKCKEGHVFEKPLGKVLHRDEWCSKCKKSHKMKNAA